MFQKNHDNPQKKLFLAIIFSARDPVNRMQPIINPSCYTRMIFVTMFVVTAKLMKKKIMKISLSKFFFNNVVKKTCQK